VRGGLRAVPGPGGKRTGPDAGPAGRRRRVRGLYLVPFIKYPANPPSIGHPETIRQRGELYLVMVVASVVLLVLAVWVGQRLKTRFGTWNAVLIAAAGFAL